MCAAGGGRDPGHKAGITHPGGKPLCYEACSNKTLHPAGSCAIRDAQCCCKVDGGTTAVFKLHDSPPLNITLQRCRHRCCSKSHTCSFWQKGALRGTAMFELQGNGVCAEGGTGQQGGCHIKRDGATVGGTASPASGSPALLLPQDKGCCHLLQAEFLAQKKGPGRKWVQAAVPQQGWQVALPKQR